MRRLKIDIDLDSGSLVIKTTLADFRELCLKKGEKLSRFVAEVDDLVEAQHDTITLVPNEVRESALLDKIIEEARVAPRRK